MVSEVDILIMAPGTRFLVEDIAREGCDGLEDIKCMKQVGPEELVAQAKGNNEIQNSKLKSISRVSNNRSCSRIF